MATLQLPVRGPFSLASSARFLEDFVPARHRGSPDGVLRLAFPVEGTGAAVGVAVRQDRDGAVLADVSGPLAERLPAQLARILSLDVDGSGFGAVRVADPVVDELATRYPGLRPVCFFSPYEAACWAVLAQRTSMVAAAAVKERIARSHGDRRQVDGQDLWGFPAAAHLRGVVDELPVPDVKRERLRALAEAALEGRLDADRLRALPVREALAEVRELPGMGSFSAELVVVRGAGAPDVFPVTEPRLHAAMAVLYGLEAPTVADLASVAERWAPYRSWVSVLIRAFSSGSMRAPARPVPRTAAVG
ncbi:DNA-3-methyladenine glycosylase family protein [Blastococcus deserti]|uniref:DNA-3-methyladenine glycosylase family protein n=1 Tax=Blastococcus deserti TaxID=2259033 RepID=A0ABW4XEH7_9ACTN